MGVAIPNLLTEDRVSGAQVIDGSLRFDSSKSHYLNRTPGSAGNRRTWTWAGWVKRSALSISYQYLFSAGTSSPWAAIIFSDDGSNSRIQVTFTAGVSNGTATVAEYRDVSAWYHIVVTVDTTQSTASDRLKIYVNGTQVTSFANTSYPSQNTDTQFNSTVRHTIGNNSYDLSTYFSGFLANIYLIDGQALDASYFGYTDALTNTWRPKKYKTSIDTYVNNGTVWSNSWGATGSTGNVDNGANAFDGSLSTYASNQNSNTTVIWQPSSPIPVRRTLRVYAAAISSGAGQVAVNGTSLGTIPGSTPQWFIIQGATQLTSISLTDTGPTHGRLYAVEVDGVILVNSSTSNSLVDNYFFGTNGFFLPFDGSAPIGQDQSGRGNNWTPVNFGGSNTLEKATGALPILNTDGGGKVARVGVRTDSSASSLVLALPLVGNSNDVSATIKGSGSNKVITEGGGLSGSSAQSVFYGGSYLFDGSNDLLSTPSSSDFDFGTGDYTAEGWVYITSTSDEYLMSMGTTVGLHWGLNFYSTNLIRAGRTDSGGTFKHEVTYNFTANRWYHIAISRQSGTSRLFLDGVLIDSKADTDNIAPNSTFYFGRYYLGTHFLNGYLQDLRIYKGLAKYTQNFIPASTDPDILPDTPSGVAYSSNVALVPSTDGAVAFDGSGDYLYLNTSSDFTVSGDFTVEAFVYLNSSKINSFFNIGDYLGSSGLILYSTNTQNALAVYTNNTLVASGGNLKLKSWNHIALVRSGSTNTLYLDGASVASYTSSATLSGDANIGVDYYNSTRTNYLDGFISNLHYVKGTALYTSNFTPPSAPISSVANTKLLCCKSNSSATAADVTPGTITANGNAAATNFNPFTVNINTQRGQESGYCVMNVLDQRFTDNGSFSNGNLRYTQSSTGARMCRATIGVSSGKWYWEWVHKGGNNSHGISLANESLATYCGGTSGSYAYFVDGSKYNNNSSSSYGSAISVGDVIGTALDLDAGTLTFYKNGISQGVAYSSLSGTFYPAYGSSSVSVISFDTNFGQKPFKFPPPAGFQPLALANTPRPSIVRPDKFMGVVTYTGNGGTQSISGLNFSPDLVWIKNRSNATGYFHALMDTIRGNTKILSSNSTTAEDTRTAQLTSFDSNGFSLGNNSDGGNYVNLSGDAYVAWSWKAGGNSNTFNIDDVGHDTASAAGLTAGTITPTGASVNTKSGFSIVSFTSDSSTNIFSVAHGLQNTPKFVIVKSRDNGVAPWYVYHSSLATDNYLRLNGTNATASDGANQWGNGMTSSVIGLRAGYTTVASTATIAYCWAEIPGFSKFGSYTGNGSADGPFVFTGFRPRWVLFKCSSDSNSWQILDAERDSYNEATKGLFPNLSNAEISNGDYDLDLLSNGIKLRTSDIYFNGSGKTFIYAAFAESPSFNLYGGQANAR